MQPVNRGNSFKKSALEAVISFTLNMWVNCTRVVTITLPSTLRPCAPASSTASVSVWVSVSDLVFGDVRSCNELEQPNVPRATPAKPSQAIKAITSAICQRRLQLTLTTAAAMAMTLQEEVLTSVQVEFHIGVQLELASIKGDPLKANACLNRFNLFML